ncbi:hypothetical protein HIL22_09105 [Staphylococcus aureus]|nr:hypothetical protein [Staphylococcus aureus]MBD3525769.1 hypothetical protein [Staphylococcus aureus]
MLTKQSQDFLEKLRIELLFRGKTEAEVEELLEELEDHLTMAEKNNEDTSSIINTPIKSMADQLSPEISLTTGLYKYITLYFSFILAVIIIPRFLDLGTFDVTIAFLLYIASIVILGVVIGMLILRNTLVRFGDQKITYVINVTYGIIVFLWMIFGGLIIKKYPIYSFFELSDKQSFIVGLVLLIALIVICILIKQKIYALIVLVISLPSLIARIAAIFSKEPDTFNLVSVSILIILNIAFIIYTFVNFRKLKKED